MLTELRIQIKSLFSEDSLIRSKCGSVRVRTFARCGFIEDGKCAGVLQWTAPGNGEIIWD